MCLGQSGHKWTRAITRLDYWQNTSLHVYTCVCHASPGSPVDYLCLDFVTAFIRQENALAFQTICDSKVVWVNTSWMHHLHLIFNMICYILVQYWPIVIWGSWGILIPIVNRARVTMHFQMEVSLYFLCVHMFQVSMHPKQTCPCIPGERIYKLYFNEWVSVHSELMFICIPSASVHGF